MKAAGALVEGGLALPLARTWAEQGAASLDYASLALDEPRMGLANTQLLGEAWVVLGRVLTQEGRPQEALRYLKAAWTLRHTAASGAALGPAYGRLGRKKDAMASFELAAVANPAEAQGIGAQYLKLTGHTLVNGAGYFYANGKRLPSPMDRLLGERTYHFRCPKGRGTVAAVLVANAEGVEAVRILDDPAAFQVPGDAAKVLKLRLEWPDQGARRVFIKGGMQFEGEKGVFVVTGE